MFYHWIEWHIDTYPSGYEAVNDYTVEMDALAFYIINGDLMGNHMRRNY